MFSDGFLFLSPEGMVPGDHCVSVVGEGSGEQV